jgi:hypothetical protein
LWFCLDSNINNSTADGKYLDIGKLSQFFNQIDFNNTKNKFSNFLKMNPYPIKLLQDTDPSLIKDNNWIKANISDPSVIRGGPGPLSLIKLFSSLSHSN